MPPLNAAVENVAVPPDKLALPSTVAPSLKVTVPVAVPTAPETVAVKVTVPPNAEGLLLLLEIPDRDNKLLYFAAVDGARFRRPVVPGDQLRIEMDVLSWRGDFCKLAGKALVNGQLAAEATLMCKMIDRVATPKPEAPSK